MHHRKSLQREKILKLLQETESHPTADWIYRKLKPEIPGLSLGTVYRNIKVLLSMGLIQKLPIGDGFDRFEAKLSTHYHLVCSKCGSVTDFQIDGGAGLGETAASRSGFKILYHRIDFFGICKQCQENDVKKTPQQGE